MKYKGENITSLIINKLCLNQIKFELKTKLMDYLLNQLTTN